MMPWWNKPKQKMLTKIIALTVSLAFIQPLVTFAFEPLTYTQPGLPVSTINYMGRIVKLPLKEATVVGTYQGSPKTVICIQDLHCNYEVQKNIAATLNYLARLYHLKLIGEEGAFGDVPTGVIKDFPNRKIKQEVADHLMRQGKLSGAEFYTVTTNRPVRLFGIEDKALYDKSLDRVHDFLNAESQGYIYDLRDQLDALKNRVYNRALKKLDQKAVAYRMGDTDLLAYAAYLRHVALSLKIDLNGYPNLNRYMSMKREFLAPEINADGLYREIDRLEDAERAAFYDRPEQRTLDSLYHRLYIMERLLNISVSQDELAAYRAAPGQYRVKAFDAFLQSQGAMGVDESFKGLDRYLEEAADFYNLADQRSQAFVDNMVHMMNQDHQTMAVMVNGGFHSEKVLALLKDKNISYLSVRPQLTKLDVVNPYFDLLQNKQTPLEQLLAKNQNILAVVSGFFNPVFNHLSELLIKVMAGAEGVPYTDYTSAYHALRLTQDEHHAHWRLFTTTLSDVPSVLVYAARKKLANLSFPDIEATTIGSKIINFFKTPSQARAAGRTIDQNLGLTWKDRLVTALERVFLAPGNRAAQRGFVAPETGTIVKWVLGAFLIVTAGINFLTQGELSPQNLALVALGIHLLMPQAIIAAVEPRVARIFSRSGRQMETVILPSPELAPFDMKIGKPEKETEPDIQQFITETVTLTLTSRTLTDAEGKPRTLDSEAQKIEGKWYLRLGDRWVKIEEENIFKAPLSSLLTSSFMLGNKQLQWLVGLENGAPWPALKPLPQGCEAITEIPDFFNNEYKANQRHAAIDFIQTINIIELAKKGALTRDILLNYLDAFVVISHKRLAAYQEFIDARQSLNLLLNIHHLLPNDSITPALADIIKHTAIFAEKRKLGFPQLLMNMIIRHPDMKNLIKTKADGKVSFLNKEGEIREIDLANDATWGTPLDQEEMLQEAKKAATNAGNNDDYYLKTNFPYDPVIPTGGSASRIQGLHFNQNKLFGRMLRIKRGHEQEALKFFADQGFDEFELWYAGDYAYIGITHLVLALNPKAATVFGGLVTIEPLEEWFGGHTENVLITQDVVHPMKSDGTMVTDTLINGGHGRIMTGLFGLKEEMVKRLKRGSVIRYNQADDRGDATLGHLMSRLLKLGRAPMAVISTPQAITFNFQIKEIQDKLKSGEPLTYQGEKIENIDDNYILLSNGTRIDLRQIRKTFEDALKETLNLKAQAERLEGPAQRDKRIEAMTYYQEKVNSLLPDYVLKDSKGKSIKLIKLDYQKGGHIVSVENENSIYEKSEYIQADPEGNGKFADKELGLAALIKSDNAVAKKIRPWLLEVEKAKKVLEAFQESIKGHEDAHAEKTAALQAQFDTALGALNQKLSEENLSINADVPETLRQEIKEAYAQWDKLSSSQKRVANRALLEALFPQDVATSQNAYFDREGREHRFPLNVVLAVDFKDFNSNNLSLDPLAVAAVMDREAKKAYHQFLLAAHGASSETEILKARKKAEVEVAAILERMNADTWHARLEIFERLTFALAAPPIEIKKGLVNMNMMAQNVSRLVAQLALSDVSMEDVDVKNIEDVLETVAKKRSYAEQAEAKNGLFKNRNGQPLSFQRSEQLKNLEVETLLQIQGRPDQFSQVKESPDFDPYSLSTNEALKKKKGDPFLAETTVGEGRVVNMELIQRQAVNLLEWMREREGRALVPTYVRRTLERMLALISRHGGALPYGAPKASVKKYKRLLGFMEQLLLLITEVKPEKNRQALQTLWRGFNEAEKEGNLLTTGTLIDRFQTTQSNLDIRTMAAGLAGALLLGAGVGLVAFGVFTTGWGIILPVSLAAGGLFLIRVWETSWLTKLRLEAVFQVKRVLHYLSQQPVSAALCFRLAQWLNQSPPALQRLLSHVPLINSLLLLQPLYRMMAPDSAVMSLEQAKDELGLKGEAAEAAIAIFKDQVINNPQILTLSDLEGDFTSEVRQDLEKLFSKHRLLVRYAQTLTETNVAMQLGIREHTAQLALELLNGIPAQQSPWKNITKSLNRGNQMVYFHLKDEPVDLKKIRVVLTVGGSGDAFLPINLQPWKMHGRSLLLRQIDFLIDSGVDMKNIYIVGNDTQIKYLKESVPQAFPNDNIVYQPLRSGSAATYALMLEKVRHDAGEDATIAFMPVSNTIGDKNIFAANLTAAASAAQSQYKLVALGWPAKNGLPNVGYVKRGRQLKGPQNLFQFSSLEEKPDLPRAHQLAEKGAVVNCGLYVTKVSRGLEQFREASPILYDWMRYVVRSGFAEGVTIQKNKNFFDILSDKANVESHRLFAEILPTRKNNLAVLVTEPQLAWDPEPIMSEVPDRSGNRTLGPGEVDLSDSTDNVVFADKDLNVSLQGVEGYFVVALESKKMVLVLPVDERQRIGELITRLNADSPISPYLLKGSIEPKVITAARARMVIDGSNEILGLGSVLESINVKLDMDDGLGIVAFAHDLKITRRGNTIEITKEKPEHAVGGTMSGYEEWILQLYKRITGRQITSEIRRKYVRNWAALTEFFPGVLALGYLAYAVFTGNWSLLASPYVKEIILAIFLIYSAPRIDVLGFKGGAFRQPHDWRGESQVSDVTLEARGQVAQGLAVLNTFVLFGLAMVDLLAGINPVLLFALLSASWLYSHYAVNRTTTTEKVIKSEGILQFLGVESETPNVSLLRESDNPIGNFVYRLVYGKKDFKDVILGEKFKWQDSEKFEVDEVDGDGYKITVSVHEEAQPEVEKRLQADQLTFHLAVPRADAEKLQNGTATFLDKQKIRKELDGALEKYQQKVLNEMNAKDEDELSVTYGVEFKEKDRWSGKQIKAAQDTARKATTAFYQVNLGRKLALLPTDISAVVLRLQEGLNKDRFKWFSHLSKELETIFGEGFANRDAMWLAYAIQEMTEQELRRMRPGVAAWLRAVQQSLNSAKDEALKRALVRSIQNQIANSQIFDNALERFPLKMPTNTEVNANLKGEKNDTMTLVWSNKPSEKQNYLAMIEAALEEEGTTAEGRQILTFLQDSLKKETLSAADTEKMKLILAQLQPISKRKTAMVNLGEDGSGYQVSAVVTGANEVQIQGLDYMEPELSHVLVPAAEAVDPKSLAAQRSAIVLPVTSVLPEPPGNIDQEKANFKKQMADRLVKSHLFASKLHPDQGYQWDGLMWAFAKHQATRENKNLAKRAVFRSGLSILQAQMWIERETDTEDHLNVSEEFTQGLLTWHKMMTTSTNLFEASEESIGITYRVWETTIDVKVPAYMSTADRMHYIALWERAATGNGWRFDINSGFQQKIDQRRTSEFSFAGAA